MADLRSLPSVDRILREPAAQELAARAGRDVAVAGVRRALDDRRRDGVAGDDRDATAAAIAQEALDREAPHLRPVVNATGVIVHTNLGRAPLAREALAAAEAVAGGYANLELDLVTGGRGSRQDAVSPLIASLTGAEAGLAVSNNAAALVLILSALAGGRDVLVSRGQLVEIGDGFRIPDILAASGARLVEVGSTNRTSAADYERAIGPDTALLLRVHPSNYRIVGFTEEVDTTTLAELGARHGVPVLDDVGSGLLVPDPVFAGEPDARSAIAAGATLVCFSGDKLLGGPQSGIIAGTREAVDRVRRHPLARAVRIGKLAVAALEETLRLHRDPVRARHLIPVLRMAHEPAVAVRDRAGRLASAIGGEVVDTESRVGGGSMPALALPSSAAALADPRGALAAALRAGDPPVIGRVESGRLLLDARTLTDDDVAVVVAAVLAARG
ncbi:MAG: L-seryl-tRNA(Ser) seleniumtransferase [Gaiellaceae bacterium]|nr:L-seryl-tRNA(Ser) seleniumtransferase [Gaiellaceae bacterium]